MDERLMKHEVPPASAHCPPARRSVGGTKADDVAVTIDQEQFNFPRTFAFMASRRLQRRYRGVYKKYSFASQVVTWVMVIYILAVLGAFAIYRSFAESDAVNVSNSFFYVLAVIIAVYIVVKIALVIQWLLYWIAIADIVAYAATGNMHALFWFDDTISTKERNAVHVIIVVLICVEAITLVTYVFTHFTYPWLVKKQKLNLVNWWNIKPGKETNTLTYRSRARFYSKHRRTVKYCGGLNSLGRPHGYGMWTDTAYHGERLTGQWEDGVPVGPFRSFEHGSGYSFVNIRVGFCHNRSEKGLSDIIFWPKHSEDSDLHWGVVSIECSVSGGFFTFLPTVTRLTKSFDPESPKSAKEMLRILRTPMDDALFLQSTSDLSRQDEDANPDKTKYLLPDAPAALMDPKEAAVKKEALVQIHGYNCSLSYSMNRLAQLLTLGDFPSYVHPYVFGWPSGGILAYSQARSTTESDRTSHDFRQFVQSLIDAGYTKLNIIAHSMGARVLMSCLAKGLLDDLLVSADTPSFLPIAGKIRLSTLTFVNPDYERSEFVRYGGGYDLARHFCEHITLYADYMDAVLTYLEIVSKERWLGPLKYSLGKRAYMLHRDPSTSDTAGRNDSTFRNWANKNLSPPADLDDTFALINHQSNCPGVTAFAYNRTRILPTETVERAYGMIHDAQDEEASASYLDMAGAKQRPDVEAPKEYLDMDVIDTTWMDNNVHAIRHNYFNINPTIVDDLRQLIVDKKRASSRSALLKTTSAENVYIFLVAPSHIKNK